MKNFVIVSSFVAFSLFITCNNKVVPVKEVKQGKYYEFVSSSPKEKVWNEIIDFFGEKRLAIKIINKDSGSITTQITSFLNSYTWIKNDSGLDNPNALVVCSMNRAPFISSSQIKPDAVTGQWVVLVKGETEKTTIDVQLASASGTVVRENSDPLPVEQVFVETHNLTIKSTGVFEKEMERAINK